jgi:hypothetical protein
MQPSIVKINTIAGHGVWRRPGCQVGVLDWLSSATELVGVTVDLTLLELAIVEGSSKNQVIYVVQEECTGKGRHQWQI